MIMPPMFFEIVYVLILLIGDIGRVEKSSTY